MSTNPHVPDNAVQSWLMLPENRRWRVIANRVLEPGAVAKPVTDALWDRFYSSRFPSGAMLQAESYGCATVLCKVWIWSEGMSSPDGYVRHFAGKELLMTEYADVTDQMRQHGLWCAEQARAIIKATAASAWSHPRSVIAKLPDQLCQINALAPQCRCASRSLVAESCCKLHSLLVHAHCQINRTLSKGETMCPYYRAERYYQIVGSHFDDLVLPLFDSAPLALQGQENAHAD